MYNDLKTKEKEEIKSEGILIFKDIMEYLIDGILTAEQYAELTRMIYATRWGDGVNEKAIQDKQLLGIWKVLKHSIKKSARNARYRENNINKKSALQEIISTEFDITPVTNNIPNNEEIENKPVLSSQIIQDDNQVESSSNGLKMGDNEIIENNKENNIEDMGNFIGYIKEPVQVVATAHTPNAFQDFLKESAFTINDIIEDFKAGGIRAKIQAPDRLKALLNTKFGKVYKEEIEEYIKARVNNPNKANLSPSNDKEVEEPQPIRDNASESLKIAKNEVKQSIPLRITASEDFRPTEKLQELINTDDNFCTIYNRCINYIADYKLNPRDFIKSNSKDIAFSKLQRIFEESGIPFNDDIKDFINNDVDAKMNSLARLEKIA